MSILAAILPGIFDVLLKFFFKQATAPTKVDKDPEPILEDISYGSQQDRIDNLVRRGNNSFGVWE